MENEEFIWESRLQKLQFVRCELLIGELFGCLKEDNLDPILIKGYAIARLYDNPADRISVDVDLCVDPKDYEEAKRLLLSPRYDRFNVDVHEGFRHLDSLKFQDIFAKTRLITVGQNQTEIRIPADEDHLRILVVHWLTDGGAYFEKLKDIYYLIKNRAEDFDWNRALGLVSKTRRRWVICVIALTHNHFGLRIDDLPIYEEIIDENAVPSWVTKCLEREWKSDVHLQPLHWNLFDVTILWRQIRKRFPPNAIQATVLCNGDFDSKPRIYYQILCVIKRIPPSLARIGQTVYKKVLRSK